MDKIRNFGYCEECGNEITSEIESADEEEICVDSEGRYFCSIECALEFYGIEKIER